MKSQSQKPFLVEAPLEATKLEFGDGFLHFSIPGRPTFDGFEALVYYDDEVQGFLLSESREDWLGVQAEKYIVALNQPYDEFLYFKVLSVEENLAQQISEEIYALFSSVPGAGVHRAQNLFQVSQEFSQTRWSGVIWPEHVAPSFEDDPETWEDDGGGEELPLEEPEESVNVIPIRSSGVGSN